MSTEANNIPEDADLDTLVAGVAAQLESEGAEPEDESGDLDAAVAEEAETLEAAESEPEAEPEAEAAEAEEPAQEAAEAEPEAAQEPEDRLQAPEHWPKDIQEAFNRADRTTQESWLAQQNEFQRGFNEKAQTLKELEQERAAFAETQRVLSQYEPFWQAQGMTVAQGVGQLAAWGAALAQNPAQVIPQLAQMYGLDMMELARGQTYVAPEDRARDTRMQSLEQQLQAQQQMIQQQRQEALVGEIQAFRDQTTADGNLAHPHFDAVADAMIGMYNSGFQGSLEQAYEQACWTNPEVRQSLISGMQQQPTQRQDLRRVDDAKRAKQASQQRVRKSQPTSGGVSTDDMDQDQLIEHLAMKQLASR